MLRKLVFWALTALPVFGGTLGFTLNPDIQSGAPGSSVIFSGTLVNLAGTDLFLTDISYSFTPPADTALTPEVNFFFQNVPGVLLGSESYSDVVFMISIASGAAFGVYEGMVSILGGDSDVSMDVLATANFQVNSVPEPGVFRLIAAGLGAFSAARKLRTRAMTAS
jgi:hypothetical protein